MLNLTSRIHRNINKCVSIFFVHSVTETALKRCRITGEKYKAKWIILF